MRRFLRQARRFRPEQPRQKRALAAGDLRRMCLSEPGNALGTRNRAILTLGFASALRRSNLVALNLEDVEFTDQGLIVRVRREKCDQEGHGRTIGVARGRWVESCPVRGLADWLRVRGTDRGGPLFTHVRGSGGFHHRLTAERVCAIVRRGVERIGLDSPESYGRIR